MSLLLSATDSDERSLMSSGKGSSDTVKLKVYFPLKSGAWSSSHTLVAPENIWRGSEVDMAPIAESETT